MSSNLAHSVHIDLLSPASLRRFAQFAKRKELIQRACGIEAGKPLAVFDATAGYGNDAVSLALAGANVTMCERCPEIASALASALAQATAHGPEWLQKAISQITLVAGDSKTVLESLAHNALPDVIIVDPMFPEERRSALSKKEIQILRALCGDDPDAPELLQIALSHTRKRVVVKRRLKDPHIGDMQPNFSLTGTTIRIDVYTKRG